MRKVSSQRVRASAISDWKIRTIWQCPKCGNKTTHYTDTNDTHNDNAIPPILFGGGSGGGSFGGGSIGGSFGGGTFGGGGSGGRF